MNTDFAPPIRRVEFVQYAYQRFMADVVSISHGYLD
jgi:hypothetical protein